MKLLYPAIFHKEDDGFWVEFPDFDGCFSQGDTLEETYENSKEALIGYCLLILEKGRFLPEATPIHQVKLKDNAFTSLVEIETTIEDCLINKTLTIPSWLNDEAIKKQVNFSNVLKEGLLKEIQR